MLFDHPCDAAASGRCASCGRGTCEAHLRATAGGAQCIACLRKALRQREQRGTLAFLRDDPYFYWYFSGGQEQAYDQYDYALFDQRGGADDGQPHEAWEGS